VELGWAVVCRDLDQHHGAANAHRGDGRFDLHVARLGDLARGEADGALDERKQGGVRRPVRVEHHLVQDHPRVRRKIERGPVDEPDAQSGPAPRLDNVALEHDIADIQLDRDAVTDHESGARDLLDPADGTTGALGRPSLGVLLRRCVFDDSLDGGSRDGGTVPRRKGRPFIVREVVVDDEPAAILSRQHQVSAGTLEVSVEQESGIGDDDDVVRARLDVQLDTPRGAKPGEAEFWTAKHERPRLTR
jgi:hypothetical protein